MSANAKKSITATAALILLGILVLLAGAKWLIVMIPAAAFVWYGVAPNLRRTRN